jgi:methyl-accepting chemotaxis protein
MLELGNIANTLSGGSVLIPRRRAVPESASVASPPAVPGNPAAAVVIQNPLSAQEPQKQPAKGELSPTSQAIEEMAAAIREKLEKFEELVEGISNGHFSAKNLSEDMKGQAEQIRDNKISVSHVYSDASELLDRFREKINEIRSFDGFLIGVHEKIEQFRHPAEFELSQVGDVAEHMTDVNADLELGVFSLAHVRQEAVKALRCQASPEPQRVLSLLEDNAQ